MRAGQLGSNGKADTSSGDLRGLGTAPQPVEHVRLVFWADPGAAVADLEPGLAAGLGQEHLDPPAGWREFDSVAEQVGDDLMQAAWVGQDRCQLKLALEADPGGGEAGLPVLGRSRGDLAGLSA